MSARATSTSSTQMPDIRLQAILRCHHYRFGLDFRGESIYERLGPSEFTISSTKVALLAEHAKVF